MSSETSVTKTSGRPQKRLMGAGHSDGGGRRRGLDERLLSSVSIQGLSDGRSSRNFIRPLQRLTSTEKVSQNSSHGVDYTHFDGELADKWGCLLSTRRDIDEIGENEPKYPTKGQVAEQALDGSGRKIRVSSPRKEGREWEQNEWNTEPDE